MTNDIASSILTCLHSLQHAANAASDSLWLDSAISSPAEVNDLVGTHQQASCERSRPIAQPPQPIALTAFKEHGA